MRVRRRVTLMAIAVSVIFAVCWLTDSISYVLTFYIPIHKFGNVTFVATATLVMFNSAVNPILYALLSQRFREKIKRMMCCSRRLSVNRYYNAREIRTPEVINCANLSTKDIALSSMKNHAPRTT